MIQTVFLKKYFRKASKEAAGKFVLDLTRLTQVKLTGF